MKILKFSLLLSFMILFSAKENKVKEFDKFKYEVVVDKLSNPWGFTFLPDGSMLITEKKKKEN